MRPKVTSPAGGFGARAPGAVLEMYQRAQATMPGECKLAVVRGATHLFEEPGTLEQVAVRARDWFINHLSRAAATANR
jgi:putative phosphoribosyl transferase